MIISNIITSNIKKYGTVMLISARSNLSYIGDVLSRQLFLAAILYILLCLWKMTYSHCGTEKMGGMNLAQMLWYLTVAEAIVLSCPPITSLIDEEVRSGGVAVHLSRPVYYPLYRLSLYLGERIVQLLANLCIGAIICLLLTKQIPVNAMGLGALIAMLPLALVIDFLGNFLIGIAAFWLENTNGILFIYSKFILLLGGVFIPLTLLPAPYSHIVKLLPFASIIYFPARQCVHPAPMPLAYCLLLQITWTAILSFFVWQMYKFALRRIAANGG